MQYKTTFYWGDRIGAESHAEVCAELTGGATYAETVGWWRDDDGVMIFEDGATVTVLHEGGDPSRDINWHAKAIAQRRGESAVLRETVDVRTAMLEADTFPKPRWGEEDRYQEFIECNCGCGATKADDGISH